MNASWCEKESIFCSRIPSRYCDWCKSGDISLKSPTSSESGLVTCCHAWTSVAEELPADDFDFQCFIKFEDGHKALSDGGTVCRDSCGQITHWMHIYKAVEFLP